ncbi:MULTISPECIES: dimethylarginine dimethylaminohydrolase family protein [Haloferax]|uniref:Amidinotransferase n=2 Tax=Haloferax TaxID=2251 RepID=A0A6G1Z6D2_9EURY|nr:MULTISPECIES: arginine deiminase-related protein [Haloferax]KAB1185391.1 hypothetical protein Hfx1149_15155 [Haloferax sp. CBA1149]MRW82035.1 hypothetical protein [Haloferax marinisediminis]
MEAECQALIEIFDRFDVTVYRTEELTDEMVAANFGEKWLVNGYMTSYSRDPIFVVGDNVIELAPGAPNRRAELLAYRKLLYDRVEPTSAKWVQMPMADARNLTDPEYTKETHAALEGGDLLVLGKTVLVGTSLNPKVGSSALGFEWLRDLLEPQGYTVERVRIGEEFLHLDVVLSVPRDGVAILCPDAFVDGIPSYFDGWDLIEVTKDQAQFLACNGMPLDPDNYILGYNDVEDGSTVQEGLEEHGITVHRIAYENHTEDGGSIRCTCHPLVRELS